MDAMVGANRRANEVWQVGNTVSRFPAQVDISPDGAHIAYVATRPDVAQNDYAFELHLVDRRSHVAPTLVASARAISGTMNFTPRFSPDGSKLAYFALGGRRGSGSRSAHNELNIYDVESDTVDKVLGLESLQIGYSSQAGVMSADEIEWSPSGRALALRIERSTEQVDDERTGVEVPVTWRPIFPFPKPGGGYTLAVLSIDDGELRTVTTAAYNVEHFDWSPDGKRIAFAATRDTGNGAYITTNIYLLDPTTEAIEKVTELGGRDSNPLWSPDGRYVAFESQAGEKDWWLTSYVAVYDTHNEQLSYPGRKALDTISGGAIELIGWTQGRGLLINVQQDLAGRLYAVDTKTGALERLSAAEVGNISNARVSGDGDQVVFVAEDIGRPRGLFVSPLVRFSPIQIAGGEELPTFNCNVGVIEWPSKDGDWLIRGVLMKPAKLSPDDLRRAPLFVYAEGGPLMVRKRYWSSLGREFSLETYCSKGFIVFVPNTRGRQGYGIRFRHSIRNDRDYMLGPLSDLLAGVAYITGELDIGDPNRMVIGGSSYGGSLTAFAIGQTSRFSAAIVHEGAIDWVSEIQSVAANEIDSARTRAIIGVGSYYDRPERRRASGISPITYVSRITTPTLLHYGNSDDSKIVGYDVRHGVPMLQGLRAFNVPSELIRYPRTGHYFEEPALREDFARRTYEWLSHWVLGHATSRTAERYGIPPKPPCDRSCLTSIPTS